MSVHRYDAKIDANQPDIIKALEACAVKVYVMKKPVDLLCCRQDKQLFLLEVKNPDGLDRITKEQAEFMAVWPGDVHIVRTPEEALRAVLGEQHVQGDTLRV
jgi:hypothetical protein